VTVGTGGTYRIEPAAGTVLFKQLLILKLSTVVLYRSAIEYNVSFAPTTMETQPPGIEHVAAWIVFVTTNRVGDGMIVGMFCVESGSGDANSTTNVVGVDCAVGGWDDADVSANASEIPPITRTRDIAPMINPLPI
jgi:hypothetical protein